MNKPPYPGVIAFQVGDGKYISLPAEWDVIHDVVYINGEKWSKVIRDICVPEYHDCGDGIGGWYCSACEWYMDENDKFCPHCGAEVVKIPEAKHSKSAARCADCVYGDCAWGETE